MPSPYWDDISPAAKDLVHKLLTVDVKQRATIKDVLSHPWVVEGGASSKVLNVGEGIKKLQARKRLRAGIRKVIAANKFKLMMAAKTGAGEGK